MKWLTHQSVGLAAAVAFKMPPVALVAVLAGAVLPDIIDRKAAALTRKPQRTFQRIHRGVSHWYGWYLLLFLLGLWGSYDDLPHFLGNKDIRETLILVCLGIGFGGLTHVLLDMLTPMGVPLFPFVMGKRLSLSLCATGSIGEYIFLVVALCFLLFLGSVNKNIVFVGVL